MLDFRAAKIKPFIPSQEVSVAPPASGCISFEACVTRDLVGVVI